VGIGLGVPSSSYGAIGRPRVLPGSLAPVATCRKKAGAARAGRLGEGEDRDGLVRENANLGVGAGDAGGSGFMGWIRENADSWFCAGVGGGSGFMG